MSSKQKQVSRFCSSHKEAADEQRPPKVTPSQGLSTATTVKAILEGALGTILYIR
jgi:hypothetical protein